MAAGFMPQNFKLPEIGNYHLLVIGIDAYANPDEYPTLNNPEKDADNFADELQKNYRFKQVIRLKNQAATRQAILESIEIFENTTKIDNIIIFFAGHGDYKQPIGYPNQNPIAYIAPYDAATSKATLIPYSSIIEQLSLIPARHILLIFDCCYSGLLLRYRNRTGAKSKLEFQAQEKFVSRKFMSSGHIQKVPDGTAGDNSPFMKALLNILKQNEDLELPIETLHIKIKGLINKINKSQEKIPLPLCSHFSSAGDDGGDMILRLEDSETDEQKAYKKAKLQRSKGHLEFFTTNYAHSLLMPEIENIFQDEYELQEKEWEDARRIRTLKSITGYLNKYKDEFFSTAAKIELIRIEKLIERSTPFYQKALEIRATANEELAANETINASIEAKYMEAIDYLTEAIKIYPDFADAYSVRADLNKFFNNHQQMIDDFSEELRIEFDAATYSERAFTKLTIGQKEDALKDFDTIIEREPNNLELYANRAFAKFRIGQAENALKDFDLIIERAPNNADFYASRASLKDNIGDTEGALEDYTRAYELDPNDNWSELMENVRHKLKNKE